MRFSFRSFQVVTVVPKLLKMKNRVRELGNSWFIVMTEHPNSSERGKVLISPVDSLHEPETYMTWVMPGRDVDLVPEVRREAR